MATRLKEVKLDEKWQRCSPKNSKNKQQMENRIHHEPDIRSLLENEGLSRCGGKYPSSGPTVLQYSVHSQPRRRPSQPGEGEERVNTPALMR
ncbi:uncharacterized [Tachysurus ichikawai]